MTSSSHAITKCRVCSSNDLIDILSLGNQFVSDFIDSEKDATLRVPLELVLCNEKSGGCGLLQLRHSASPESMYRNYWYKSGMNQTMRDALADITTKAKMLVDLEKDDIVLDIGANDGTLLRSYNRSDIRTIGIDPAVNLVKESSIGTTKIINDFFGEKVFHDNFPGEKAKIITSIAMFYDLEDPNSFVSDISKCLDNNGVWIIQMSYLPLMLDTNAFDNICHEHLEYYSLLSLENLIKRHDLEVFDIEMNDVNGGSFRVYIKHKNSTNAKEFEGSKYRVKMHRIYEKSLGLDDTRIYQEFSSRVQKLKKDLLDLIHREVANGKKIYVYGASTKGNTLLQYYGLTTKEIPAAAERNPDKWGKKTVGTLIPIVSEAQAREDKPDYFLVLPWHFAKEFIRRESEFLKNGGRLIFPLPEFRVVEKSSVQ